MAIIGEKIAFLIGNNKCLSSNEYTVPFSYQLFPIRDIGTNSIILSTST